MKNDLALNLARPHATIATLCIPLIYLILFSLFALSGGMVPATVYQADQGKYSQPMKQALTQARTFRIHTISTESQGQENIDAEKSVAAIKIPYGFTDDVLAGRPSVIHVKINNMNSDFADDIRRGLPLGILQFYQNSLPKSIPLQWNEKEYYPSTVSFLGFLSVSIVTVGMLVGGLLFGGRGISMEWEGSTMKELQLAPIPAWNIITGKLLAGLLNGLIASIFIVLGLLILGIKPQNPIELATIIVVLLVVFVSLGIAAGSLLRSQAIVTALAFALGMPVFFISGAFGPISWATPAIADTARLFPVVYANAMIQHAFHGYLPIDVSIPVIWAILIAWTIGALGISIWTYKRTNMAN
jgi:ABC-type transport system involved in multi-copper enzyme maturation permease subunit